MINALVVGTGVLVLIGILLAEPLTHALASGREFAEVPGKLALTTLLTRLMLPFLTTVAVAAAMMGMLNSLHRFFIPALSPAMFNVATIAAALLLVPLMPRFGLPGIAAIAIGTIFGGLGQVVVQWPALHREGYRYKPILDFRDPGLRHILKLMAPGTLGLAAVQINVFVNTYLATTQQQGAVSWLNYAFRLIYLPIGLFGVSIATAALPDIARHAAALGPGSHPVDRRAGPSADADAERPRDARADHARPPDRLVPPRARAIHARRHGGDGGSAHVLRTGAARLLPVKIASPTFYSLHDSRTPVIASVLTVILNLVLNLVLVRFMGYRGLALGTAAAAIFNAVSLLWLLRARLDGIEGRQTSVAFAKILAASAVMSAVAWAVNHLLEGALPGGAMIRKHIDVYLSLRLMSAIAAGCIALIVAARALRIEEFDQAAAKVLRRLSAGRDQSHAAGGRSAPDDR